MWCVYLWNQHPFTHSLRYIYSHIPIYWTQVVLSYKLLSEGSLKMRPKYGEGKADGASQMNNEATQDHCIIDYESSGSSAKSESPSNSTSSNDHDDLSPTNSAFCKSPSTQHQRKLSSPRAATMDISLPIRPNEALDDMPLKATSAGSPVIDLDISSWKPTIQAKVEEYSAVKGKLSSQQYRIPCDHSTFISGFGDVKIPGAK